MNFHILTLFPEIFEAYFGESILGRARKKGLVTVSFHQLRDYAQNKHRSVDDRPYGGGSGMILRPEVVVGAVRDIKAKHTIERVLLLSPRGPLFTHQKAEKISRYSSCLLVCGRYEGVDERAIELVIDEELSIGDYVLTGGELAAQVVVDAVSRLLPGVLGNDEGPINESHAQGLLEHPQYTRPPEFEGLKVPDVLLSGNHEEIDRWREGEAKRLTERMRPDLIKKA
jgi:tRNA (guanine37-N1)-methyltransferase